MSLIVSCKCGKKYKVGEDKAGKRIKCAGCGSVLTIPLPEVEEEADPWESSAAEDEYEEDLPPARSAPPAARRSSASREVVKRPKKKSSGSRKGLLIGGLIGGGLLFFVLLGVGGYFAYRQFFSNAIYFSGYSVDLAWIPEGAVSAAVMQPAAFLQSDFAKTLEYDKKVNEEGSTDEDRAFIKSFDLILYAEGRSDPGKSNSDEKSAMIVHFNTSQEVRERFKKQVPIEKWQPAEAGGKKYWKFSGNKPGEAPSNISMLGMGSFDGSPFELGLYAPNDRTLVFGTDAAIRGILTTSYKKTPLRAMLGGVDTNFQYIMAATDANSPESPRPMIPGMGFSSFLPQLPSAGLLAGKKFKSYLVGMGVTGRNLLQVDLECADEAAKNETEKDINNLKEELSKDFNKTTRSGKPHPYAELGKKMLEGTTTSVSGLKISVTVRRPSGFAEDLAKAKKER